MHWGAQHSLYQLQTAMSEFIHNFPVKAFKPLLTAMCFPIGKRCKRPDDQLGGKVAELILSPSTVRDQLIEGCYRNQNPNDPVGRIEYSFMRWIETEEIREILKEASDQDKLPTRLKDINLLLEEQRAPFLRKAVDRNIITQQQADALDTAALAVWDAIQVDHFDPQELVKNSDTKSAVTAPMDGPEVSRTH